MTLTIFTNCVHHHQIPIADEFYKILGEKFQLVAMQQLPQQLVNGGYDPNIERPYIVRAYENSKQQVIAKNLMLESDVVIVSYGPVKEMIERIKNNKITFFNSERWLKQKWRIFDVRFLYRTFFYHYRYRNNRSYMLCSSAFTAEDVKKFNCYLGKCFKWGYFTRVDDINRGYDNINDVVRFMWCARFLSWKHPELPMKLAQRLKAKGFRIQMDMFGSGTLLESTKTMAMDLGVDDIVSFCGNLPNEEILKQMEVHDIFLFTSDRREGWGAVANEALSNGCILIASNEIGAIPFLVKEGINGFIFRSCDIDSLEEVVVEVFKKKNQWPIIQKNAIKTMHDIWSPETAAKNFLRLVEYIIKDKLDQYDFSNGPAGIIKD